MRIGIIAALPGELKTLVRGWDRLPVVRGSGIQMWERPASAGGHDVVAVCGGMGAAAARRAFSAVEFRGALDMALSVGWAGALRKESAPGDSFECCEVIDAQTGERFAAGGGSVKLVTTAHVVNSGEKYRLAQSYGAALVDMEAAVIGRLAQMRGIPMRCFKAVSDELGAKLPDLNPFIQATGQMKMTSFLAHVALRPQHWGPLMQLGRNSSLAAKNLARDVTVWLEQQDRGE